VPKMKTHRGAAKRFRRTRKGKFKRTSAFHRHLMTKKSGKRTRQLKGYDVASDADSKRLKKLLPYSG